MAVDKIPPQIQLLHEMHRIACLEQVLFLTSGFVQKSQCVLKTCLCIWFANWCVDLCVTVFCLCLYLSLSVFEWMYFAGHQLSGQERTPCFLSSPSLSWRRVAKCQIFYTKNWWNQHFPSTVYYPILGTFDHGYICKICDISQLCPWSLPLAASVKYDGRRVMFCMKWWSGN